jgi:hypothetical protein
MIARAWRAPNGTFRRGRPERLSGTTRDNLRSRAALVDSDLRSGTGGRGTAAGTGSRKGTARFDRPAEREADRGADARTRRRNEGGKEDEGAGIWHESGFSGLPKDKGRPAPGIRTRNVVVHDAGGGFPRRRDRAKQERGRRAKKPRGRRRLRKTGKTKALSPMPKRTFRPQGLPHG